MAWEGKIGTVRNTELRKSMGDEDEKMELQAVCQMSGCKISVGRQDKFCPKHRD